MSRIGNKVINLPAGVEVKVEGATITVKGPKGELTKTFNNLVNVEVKENQVFVTRINEEKHTKQMHGTTRSIINGMVVGVSEGYKKILLITGTGYRAAMEGKNLVLNLGYSHPIEIAPVEGVKVECISNTEIHVSGCSKEIVGQVAAEIRAKRGPEPYKGKGIRYSTEVIRRKESKKAGK